MIIRRDAKYVVFTSREEAERFTLLYGGFISCCDDFYLKYFGDKIRNKVIVIVRMTADEIDEACKTICLKKRKWNNKLVYIY